MLAASAKAPEFGRSHIANVAAAPDTINRRARGFSIHASIASARMTHASVTGQVGYGTLKAANSPTYTGTNASHSSAGIGASQRPAIRRVTSVRPAAVSAFIAASTARSAVAVGPNAENTTVPNAKKPGV
ncbi:MAG: hypothetical protein E6J72_21595 [Deltaproteobacteria bacterium]|nr:MAG: hypothetical protein E6J72_21595 [Deltaproteobacteria bacterium]